MTKRTPEAPVTLDLELRWADRNIICELPEDFDLNGTIADVLQYVITEYKGFDRHIDFLEWIMSTEDYEVAMSLPGDETRFLRWDELESKLEAIYFTRHGNPADPPQYTLTMAVLWPYYMYPGLETVMKRVKGQGRE